jgi:hypothetical protein
MTMGVETGTPLRKGTDHMPASDARPPWPGQPTAVLCGFCYPAPIEFEGQMQSVDSSAATGLVPAGTGDEDRTSLHVGDVGATS